MSSTDFERRLAEAQETIRALQDELAETNRGLLALTLELDKRVAERTAQLEAANRELEAFSYSVSHDLRTPLHSIESFAKLLVEEEGGQLSPDHRQYVELIHANARQMIALVNSLLSLSRAGREPLNRQRIVMADLARQALAELKSEQDGRQVDIVFGDLPDAEADPVLLKQVWVNLLSNALKFTRGRPVARIEIGSYPKDGKTVYVIKDNGAGFDSEHASRLFGVFQRFHPEHEFEGTGIGLAIVQRIIHRHNGEICAQSQVGQGATFFFTLG